MADPKRGGGLDEAVAAERERGGLGGETDLTSPDDPLAAEPVLGGGAGSLAGLDGGGIAVEAASLGSADGSLADRAAESEAERPGASPSGAERGLKSAATPRGEGR